MWIEQIFYENPADDMLKGLPRIVFRTIVDQHLDIAMQTANLSTARIATKVGFITTLVFLQIYVLFLGFTAFTDATSLSAACLNSALILAVGSGHLACFADDGDREGSKDEVEALQDGMAAGIQRVLSLAAIQITAANRHLDAARKLGLHSSTSSLDSLTSMTSDEEEEEEEEDEQERKKLPHA